MQSKSGSWNFVGRSMKLTREKERDVEIVIFVKSRGYEWSWLSGNVACDVSLFPSFLCFWHWLRVYFIFSPKPVLNHSFIITCFSMPRCDVCCLKFNLCMHACMVAGRWSLVAGRWEGETTRDKGPPLTIEIGNYEESYVI